MYFQQVLFKKNLLSHILISCIIIFRGIKCALYGFLNIKIFNINI